MLSRDAVNTCPSIFHNTFSHPVFIEKILIIIYSMIFIIGIVGNIMTIIIIKCNTQLRTITNLYLLNLAVSDLMMLICNLPLEMIEIYYREWPLSIMFCRLRNICVEFFTCSSILTILAFSCERYFAIVHPMHFHQLNRFHRAKNVIVIIWSLSLLISVPIGFSYEIEKNIIVTSSRSTSFIVKTMNNSKFQQSNETLQSINLYCKSCVPKKTLAKLLSIVMIVISICCFYFPMIMIGIIYLFIIKALSHVNKYEKHSNSSQLSQAQTTCNQIQGRKLATSSTSFNSGTMNKENSIEIQPKNSYIGSYSWLRNRAHYQARKVVIKTLVAVVIAFFICYAPLYLQRVLSAIMSLNSNLNSDSYIFSNVMAYLYVISGITFYFGSIINPILYNLVSNKYRRAFRDLCFCRLTFKTKSNIKSQRKFGKQNLQQIRSFNQKLAVQECRNDTKENPSTDNDHENNTNRNLNRPISIYKHLRLSNIQSVPLMHSYNTNNKEQYQTYSLRSNTSLSRKMSSTQYYKNSLGEKILLPENSQLTQFHS